MPIRVQCPCGQQLAVKDEFAGKTVKCPKCSKALRIPQSQTAVAGPGGPLGAGMDDLFEDVGLKHQKDRAATCPGCKAPLQPGAVLCINCGYDLRSGTMRQSVGSVLDNVSLKNDAERRVAKAASRLSEATVTNDSDSFGDAGSIWAWLMPFALPFLLIFSVVIAAYWGLVVGYVGKRLALDLVAELGWYEIIFPLLLFGFAVSMFYTPWWNVSLHCVRVNVWLGLLSLGSLGFLTAFFGIPFWSSTRFNMIVYYIGLSVFLFAILTTIEMVLIRLIGASAALMILPFFLLYIGVMTNLVYWVKLTLIAFSESMTQGLVCLFTYFYAPIYGVVRWQYCKWETLIWGGSLLLTLFSLGLSFVLFFVVIVVDRAAFNEELTKITAPSE